MQPQRQQGSHTNVLDLVRTRAILSIVVALALGGLFGALLTAHYTMKPKNPDQLLPNGFTPNAVAVMVVQGERQRSWNGVTKSPGQSVADLLDMIAKNDGLPIVWNGADKERVLVSFADPEPMGGAWHLYVNGSSPTNPLAKFYPKPGDVILVTHEAN